ncbi:hypothetical protein EV643_10990 [Kribbella sp. VKM Ac-2527]|uniref:DUF362 domain-containing protein n=1 Tax=Kribbella caucasensis TaxID=2512215 RepID=A0A4R6KEQ0_9ACTN|nr:hypothetical protein [Kribbella sp. VKM Ac-2527]TDO47198.1 hypothetical protein EV643_10990 [Kribbella sp. VKM Ac-2527]
MALGLREGTPGAAVVRADSVDEAIRLVRDGLRDAGVDLKPPSKRRASAVMLAGLSGPAAVEPRVVDELVDLLCERGWTSVAVAGACTLLDRDAGVGDVDALAAAAGLTGTTAAGNEYALVDLHSELVPAPVPASSVLADRDVSKVWVDAALRIVLARSASDLADGYAGCLELLAEVVVAGPEISRADLAVEVHRRLPAAVAVIDATVSSHGISGRSRFEPLETCALVVADDALLADVVIARLHGQDPAVSRPVQAALREIGLPEGRSIVGDLTPFTGWLTAPPLTREAVRAAGPVAERVAAAALRRDDEGDPVLAALRQGVEAVEERGGEAMLAAGFAALGYGASSGRALLDAWSTVFDKGRVGRIDVPLGFDPAGYDEAEYEAIPAYLAAFEQLLAGHPRDDGLHWTYLDGSVVFEISRLLEAPYEEFVERVDISRGISLMADYLGGRVVPIKQDELGRPILQAERNLYLPQPNYLASWGGLPIDVCKIELVEYGDDMQRLSWRTVASPNDSATYDDGALTFAAAPGERTRVTVMGRQLFTLPAFWKAVDLDRFPELKAPLVEDAYRRFFTATFDNLEACFEGRDHRIGRDPEHSPLPTESASLLLEVAKEWLAEEPVGDRLRGSGRPQPVLVDAHGFRHFSGSSSDSARRRS